MRRQTKTPRRKHKSAAAQPRTDDLRGLTWFFGDYETTAAMDYIAVARHLRTHKNTPDVARERLRRFVDNHQHLLRELERIGARPDIFLRGILVGLWKSGWPQDESIQERGRSVALIPAKKWREGRASLLEAANFIDETWQYFASLAPAKVSAIWIRDIKYELEGYAQVIRSAKLDTGARAYVPGLGMRARRGVGAPDSSQTRAACIWAEYLLAATGQTHLALVAKILSAALEVPVNDSNLKKKLSSYFTTAEGRGLRSASASNAKQITLR